MAWWLMHLTATRATSVRVSTLSLFFSSSTSTLYPNFTRQTGVCRGIPNFLIFCSGYSLEAVLTCTHNLCFEQNKEKYIYKNSAKQFQFSKHSFEYVYDQVDPLHVGRCLCEV